MANIYEPQSLGNEPIPESPGSGKGCLWGCLIAVGLFVGAVLCAGVGGYFFVSSQITKYTSETQVELPTVDYSEDQLAELDSRVESFREKLDAGETPEEDLVLTADDINAMIGSNKDLKGKVFVKIKNEQVEGDVSFPTDMIPFGKGRFFNGSATFEVSMEGGVLIVTAQQAEVNGEPVPEEIMQGLRNKDLAKEFYKDPKNAKFMRQFEDIRIEDDKFILRVKREDKPEDKPETVQENLDVETSLEESAGSVSEEVETDPEPATVE